MQCYGKIVVPMLIDTRSRTTDIKLHVKACALPAVLLDHHMKINSQITCAIMLICVLSMRCAISVVNGQTVYNVPPDTPPGTVGANTIVNVLPDGQISGTFNAENGSIVNVQGGRFDNVLHAKTGATVNMSGGNVDSALRMFDGSELKLSRGTMGQIAIREGSDVTILGYGFHVDGVALAGLESVGSSTQVLVPFRSLLSGSLQDGTPFAFIDDSSGEDVDEVITLTRVAAPILPPAITISSATSLLGIGMGQMLTIEEGAIIPNNFNIRRGGVVEINGGEIGRKFEAVDAQVTVNDGLIDGDFSTYEGTITEVNGGSILGTLDILKGSIQNVRGGSVGTGTNSRIWDSEFNVSGGTVRKFTALKQVSVSMRVNLLIGSFEIQ